jgi:class 3 adenylate cyclase
MMGELSFRRKLLGAMMLVVAGSAGLTLATTQRRIEATYRRLSQQQFDQAIASFTAMQDARLEFVKRRCRELGQSVRLRAALVVAAEEDAVDLLYESAADELRDVLREASFYRFLGPDGQVLTPSDRFSPGFATSLATVWQGLQTDMQQVGFLPLPTPSGGIDLQEVIISKIVHPVTDEPLGALVLAFPIPVLQPASPAAAQQDQMLLGFFLDDHLFARPLLPQQAHLPVLEAALRDVAERGDSQGDFVLSLDGAPFRVFYRVPNPGSPLLRAYQVCLYSLADEYRDRRELRFAVMGFAALGLAGAFGLASWLSHGLSAPIRDLVDATGEIRRGNLSVQVPVRAADEIGRLTSAFNEMTLGLAQKERYRNLLDLVADEQVAQRLLEGQNVALGGERREVTMLFCDIRGFTERTASMPPEDVIDMLNEHMTILTRVIKAHHGVVDKFVGDCVMAIFGAPFSRDDDVLAAARCALQMVEERQLVNQSSRHALQVGIGMSTGVVVAGCMGSVDRMNYTVLGERVNLASRLAGKAGPMEILIDVTTKERLDGLARVELLEPLRVKGFEGMLTAFRLKEVARAA